jgi:hypothetical protein
MKTNEMLIVPDIHGRDFWKPALEYAGEVLFLGDYVDHYPQEGFSEENAYEGLQRIVAFKQEFPERVTLLVGNHEFHYFNMAYQASRFDGRYYDKYHDILTGDTTNLFQMCKQVGNFLFIHAGITKGWYDLHRKELLAQGDTLEAQINGLFRSKPATFYECSGYRGGWDNFSSPIWADIHELWEEPEPFAPDIIQIVGHTQSTKEDPIIEKNVWLVDNKQLYLLSDGELKKWG